MNYYGVVYFAGPLSRFAGRIDEREVIARIRAPWRWLALVQLLSAHGSLDASKCGYALMRDGVCIEQYDPPLRDPIQRDSIGAAT